MQPPRLPFLLALTWRFVLSDDQWPGMEFYQYFAISPSFACIGPGCLTSYGGTLPRAYTFGGAQAMQVRTAPNKPRSRGCNFAPTNPFCADVSQLQRHRHKQRAGHPAGAPRHDEHC
jgi:hypothetical protein